MEDAESISSVIRDCSDLEGDITYIPLTPEALYAFERSHISCIPISNYLWDDECERQGMENFTRIERLSGILDPELGKFHPVLGLFSVRNSIFDVKILLDVLWTKILILKKIIDTERPDCITLYVPGKKEHEFADCVFRNDESLYAELLAMDGWEIPVVIIFSPDPSLSERKIPVPATPPLKNRIRQWIKKYDVLFNVGIIITKTGFLAAGISVLHAMRPGHSPVLIYGSGYNWDDSLTEFYRQGVHPVFRINNTGVARTPVDTSDFEEEILRICNKEPGLKEFEEILGVDVSSFFFKRLSRILGISTSDSIRCYERAKEQIANGRIRCLLLSTRENACPNAVIHAAKDSGIPVVSWQHGGGGYTFWPMIPAIEFFHSDVHFVFTESVAHTYSGTATKIGLHSIPVFFPTGSSSLDILCKKNNKIPVTGSKKRIIYITTHYEKNIFFISHPFDPIHVDEHLWFFQKRILDLASRFPDRDFVVKLHPANKSREPLMTYVLDKRIGNVDIILSGEISIPDLMAEADIIIIDHITTGILQILTSDLPVFVYNGISRIDKESLASLKKRTYVYDDIDTLIKDLVKYIPDRTTLDPTVNRFDTDFILKYGTDITTLNSAEKAVKKLRELITDSSKKL